MSFYNPPPPKTFRSIFAAAKSMFLSDFPLMKRVKQKTELEISNTIYHIGDVVVTKDGQMGFVTRVGKNNCRIVLVAPTDVENDAQVQHHKMAFDDLDLVLEADKTTTCDTSTALSDYTLCLKNLMTFEQAYNGSLIHLNKRLRAGTRQILSREAELNFSYSKAISMLLELSVLIYSLLVQVLASSSSWSLISFLLFKELFVISWPVVFLLGMTIVVVATLTVLLPGHVFFGYFGIPRRVGMTSSEVYHTSLAAMLVEVKVLCDMTMYMSTLHRMYRLIWTLFVRREANPSIRDMDAKFTSLTSVVFNITLVMQMGEKMFSNSVLAVLVQDAHQMVLLNLLLSLILLFKNLVFERSILYSHYESMKDINDGNMTSFELTLYLHRLMDDFLSEPVKSDFLEVLRTRPYNFDHLKHIHEVVVRNQFPVEHQRVSAQAAFVRPSQKLV
eukprot:c12550_g1_i1.p1 GENE.c12550_g1_i1~~c12550_g1_i1.p1  ORF type:complete len:461 (-),score=124.40 c12550_g1_i1:412-1746(-)